MAWLFDHLVGGHIHNEPFKPSAWRAAHGGTAGTSGIEQNVSTCGNIEKVIRYRPSMSLVARQCWSSRAGEAAQHESG